MFRNLFLVFLFLGVCPAILSAQLSERGKIEEQIIESLKDHKVSISKQKLLELKELDPGTIEENNNVLFFEALIAQSNQEPVKAILTYQKLLKRIPLEDVGTKSKVLHNLSAIYMDLYQTEAATQYILKAKREIWKTEDFLSRGKIAMQLADLYLIQHQYKKALLACNDAQSSFKLAETDDYEFAAKLKGLYSQSNLGVKINNEELKQILDKAFVLENGVAGRVTITTAHIHLANILISNFYELEKAKTLLDNFTPICDELNLDVMKAVAYEAYSNYYTKIQNLESGLIYLKKFSSLKDSISIEGNRLKLNGLRVIHEVEQQRQNIRDLKKETRYQTLWVWFLISVIVSLSIISWVVFKGVKRRLNSAQIELVSKNLALDNERLASRNLEVENELKKRELLSNVLLMNQKNELFEKVEGILEPLLENEGESADRWRNALYSIKSGIQSNALLENNWENFIYHFEQVHPDFFTNLQKKYKNLTSNDLRHCAYIKMNLSRKEISLMLNVNIDAVKMARNRIKKKMNLSDDESLQSVVSDI